MLGARAQVGAAGPSRCGGRDGERGGGLRYQAGEQLAPPGDPVQPGQLSRTQRAEGGPQPAWIRERGENG